VRLFPLFVAASALGSTLLLSRPAAAQVVLYDGSQNTLPGAQGWTSVVIPPATQTVSGGATTLDTFTSGSNALQAGYLRTTSFALDRTAGFTVRFDAQLLNETHASNDRAGFSVIVLSNDMQGIELGFWNNEVWAQSGALFTHAEGAAFNTTAAGSGAAGTIRYDLTFQGNSYSLFANGGATPILTGAVRDYTAFTGSPDPYETPNFLFFGDNTTSARGSFRLAQVTVATSPATAAPEPGTFTLVLVGGIAVAHRFVKRRRSGSR
jgi:hypothetical protein